MPVNRIKSPLLNGDCCSENDVYNNENKYVAIPVRRKPSSQTKRFDAKLFSLIANNAEETFAQNGSIDEREKNFF